MSSTALHYPTAIKKRVLGDWNCAQCQNLNFSFRDVCNRCGANRVQLPVSKFHYALFLTPRDTPTPKQGTPDDRETGPSMFNIDELPSVSPFLNEKCMTTPTEARPISSRLLQFDGLEKDEPEALPSLQEMQLCFNIKRPATEKVGDWVCGICLNFNFAFRSECNRCHTPKDAVNC